MGRFWFFLLVLIAIAGGGGYYFLSNINGIVKASIEETGSAATKTTVKVDSVNLGVFQGKGTLAGLKVANPEGFATTHALAFDTIGVKLDPATLLGTGPILIHEVTVEQPSITYEARGILSNLGTIQKNVSDYASAMGGGGAKGKGRKLIIENLYLRGGTISISHSALGEALSAELPLIHLKNIGTSSGGASAAAVATHVLRAILTAATKAAVAKLVLKLGPVGEIEKLGIPNPLRDIFGGD